VNLIFPVLKSKMKLNILVSSLPAADDVNLNLIRLPCPEIDTPVYVLLAVA
jgi:hypothetical protein